MLPYTFSSLLALFYWKYMLSIRLKTFDSVASEKVKMYCFSGYLGIKVSFADGKWPVIEKNLGKHMRSYFKL